MAPDSSSYSEDKRWLEEKLEDHDKQLTTVSASQITTATTLAVIGAAIPRIEAGIGEIKATMMTRGECEGKHSQLKADLEKLSNRTISSPALAMYPEVPSPAEERPGFGKRLANNDWFRMLVIGLVAGGLSIGGFRCSSPGGWSCEGTDLKKEANSEVTSVEERPEGTLN